MGHCTGGDCFPIFLLGGVISFILKTKQLEISVSASGDLQTLLTNIEENINNTISFDHDHTLH